MIGIDLFAGCGGTSTGARAAGVHIAWAANHWPLAVQVHAQNHPETQHVCQDLHQADWTQVPDHDLLLASPACQGHTKARGKERAHHDASRSTAWAVIAAAEACRPPVVIVENVQEMLDWQLMPAWRQAMNALGYTMSANVIDAADLGVPQHRERLFLVCTRSTVPIELKLEHAEHVSASEVVDFSAGRWTQVDRPGRAESTLARIKSGREQHGDRFLIAYYGSARGGRSLNRPIGTLTTRARYAVIDGNRMRMLSVPEAVKAMSFPDDYRLPTHVANANHLIGNAVPPLMAQRVIEAVRRAA